MSDEARGQVARAAVVRLLSEIGEKVYVPLFLQENTKEFGDVYGDWIEALKFFLSGYAYERQGRSPDYAPTAVAAVDEILPEGRRAQSPSLELTENLWREFCRIGNYIPAPDQRSRTSRKGEVKPPNPFPGANAQNNPLSPKDHKDVVSVCRARLESNRYNLCAFARSALRSDRAKEAHVVLKEIRGVKDKIASFFLRDIALQDGIDDRSLRNPEVLQPIDVWVRRTVAILGQIPEAEQSDETAAAQAVALATQADDCSALKFNAGAWYFGSQVVGRYGLLADALNSTNSVKSRLLERSERMNAEAGALRTVTEE